MKTFINRYDAIDLVSEIAYNLDCSSLRRLESCLVFARRISGNQQWLLSSRNLTEEECAMYTSFGFEFFDYKQLYNFDRIRSDDLVKWLDRNSYRPNTCVIPFLNKTCVYNDPEKTTIDYLVVSEENIGNLGGVTVGALLGLMKEKDGTELRCVVGGALFRKDEPYETIFKVSYDEDLLVKKPRITASMRPIISVGLDDGAKKRLIELLTEK